MKKTESNYENIQNEFAICNNMIQLQIRLQVNKLGDNANNIMRDRQNELQHINSKLETLQLDLELESDELYTSKSNKLNHKCKELNKNTKKQKSIERKSI